MGATTVTRQDFIPRRDNDFLTWHDNFTTQLLLLQGVLQLPENPYEEIEGENCYLREKVQCAVRSERASQLGRQELLATRRAVEAGVRARARQIKAHPAYTPEMGAQLGIEGGCPDRPLWNIRPILLPTVAPLGVVVRFNMEIAEAINIYSRRADEIHFTFLARDTHSPYIDTRPCMADTPEEREYLAAFVDGGDEVGISSDIVKVVCRL